MKRVAVVGTGSAGLRHLANLARLGVDELVAVSEHHRRRDVVVDGRKVCVIHDYDGTTKVASISPNWTTNPSSDSVYEVVQAAPASTSNNIPTPF